MKSDAAMFDAEPHAPDPNLTSLAQTACPATRAALVPG